MCGLEIARTSPDCNSQSVPRTACEEERLGFRTRKDLHVLCYQHHTEMLLRLVGQPAERSFYACREPGCLVRYTDSDGYFVDTKEAKIIEQETTPRVTCPNDGQLMYLAAVTPEKRSFRLWKCPQCNSSRANEDASDGRGKSAEA
jgi:hypothetical protein